MDQKSGDDYFWKQNKIHDNKFYKKLSISNKTSVKQPKYWGGRPNQNPWNCDYQHIDLGWKLQQNNQEGEF